ELSQSIDRSLPPYMLISVFTMQIDANRVTAKKPRGFHPFIMIFYRFFSLRRIRRRERAFQIHHDQQAFHSIVATALLKGFEIALVFGFILKKLAYIFNGMDIVLFSGYFRKIQRSHFFSEKRFMQRPLSQRY